MRARKGRREAALPLRWPVVRAAACVFALLSLAGCSLGGENGGSVEVTKLSGLVLQPDDLTPAYERFDEGRQVMADSPGGSRSDPRRFGRQEGWKSRYRRGGTPQTEGPLVVESRADLFESSGGAKDELDAARQDLEDSDLDWRPIDEPGLGDESFAATLVPGGGTNGVRFFQVVWREANVTASLNVNGFEGRIALAEALELARKQERRISSASSG
jgi:hypothetical protein